MTIARWQRWVVALQLLLAALLLWWSLRWGWQAVVAVLVGMPLCARLPLALQFALAARASAAHSPHAHPGWASWLRAWWQEGTCATWIFGWWQPFRQSAIGDALQPLVRGRGMVLVHGFGCNRGFWMPWLRRLRREGRAFVAVNLEPPLGGIDGGCATIDAAVRDVTRATGQTPLVVAHSMGGLAVRAWMRAAPDADARVHRVVMLGVPHRGTQAARFAFSVNGRQMRPDSPWLRALAQAEPPQRRALFECWQTDCDNVVYPPGSAWLEGGEEHTLHGLGHVRLAFDARVMQACWGWLRE